MKYKKIMTFMLCSALLFLGGNKLAYADDTVEKDELAPLKIMRHLKGVDKITRSSDIEDLDIDLDGELTDNDVDLWMEYLTGARTDLLAIEDKELPSAALNSLYSVKLKAIRGTEPYKWTKVKGSLPTGMKLNSSTGEITGTPTKEGTSTFTIKVTDGEKYTYQREFKISVVDTDIKSVTKPSPVTVQKGKTPDLPSKVTVIYKDNSTGKENVDWEDVDTSTLGKKVVSGKVGTSGISVTMEVIVVGQGTNDDKQIDSIETVNPIKVLINETPELPSSIAVTYKDGSVKMEEVIWDSVNTKTLGTKDVKGTLKNLDISIETQIIVVEELSDTDENVDPIQKIEVNYVGILDLHSIVVEADPEVYAVNIEASVYNSKNKLVKTTIPMHYDPPVNYGSDGEPTFSTETRFTLATPRLIPGSEITIVSYDKFNNEIARKTYKLDTSNE
ncbi:Ig-like domain-containing protein [Clostridium sp.]|jgi:hypothetical protein|uniref:Ig-like domain-containing protein n=1 Tax=Clostridium sp. TaxID=1506 RepID=UPI0039F5DE48